LEGIEDRRRPADPLIYFEHSFLMSESTYSRFPLISIVTPCLNRAAFIAEAIESVMRQDYPHIEHIIVDGGSTDGTLDIVRQYKHLRVLSERDENLYDALNKGIRLSSGDIIGHLNSDDCYEPNVFSDVVGSFTEDRDTDSVCGGAVIFENTTGNERRILAKYIDSENKGLSYFNLALGVPIINARFFRRHVYDRIGEYDTSFPIAADRDFLIRAAIAGVKTSALDRRVIWYRAHPGSLTIRSDGGTNRRKQEDNIRLSRKYLRQKDIPVELREALCALHTRETLEQAVDCLKRLKIGDVLSCVFQGCLEDRTWPWQFGSYFARRFGASLSRRITRRQTKNLMGLGR